MEMEAGVGPGHGSSPAACPSTDAECRGLAACSPPPLSLSAGWPTYAASAASEEIETREATGSGSVTRVSYAGMRGIGRI